MITYQNMSEFPLKIGESSGIPSMYKFNNVIVLSFILTLFRCLVVNISTADGCVHPLYVIPRSSTEIKILNIPPFYNRSSLYSFFSTFGPISRLSYSKVSADFPYLHLLFARISYL